MSLFLCMRQYNDEMSAPYSHLHVPRVSTETHITCDYYCSSPRVDLRYSLIESELKILCIAFIPLQKQTYRIKFVFSWIPAHIYLLLVLCTIYLHYLGSCRKLEYCITYLASLHLLQIYHLDSLAHQLRAQ